MRPLGGLYSTGAPASQMPISETDDSRLHIEQCDVAGVQKFQCRCYYGVWDLRENDAKHDGMGVETCAPGGRSSSRSAGHGRGGGGGGKEIAAENVTRPTD